MCVCVCGCLSIDVYLIDWGSARCEGMTRVRPSVCCRFSICVLVFHERLCCCVQRRALLTLRMISRPCVRCSGTEATNCIDQRTAHCTTQRASVFAATRCGLETMLRLRLRLRSRWCATSGTPLRPLLSLYDAAHIHHGVIMRASVLALPDSTLTLPGVARPNVLQPLMLLLL
jgi:hypothetical protein